MSAVIKATTVLSGLALATASAAYSLRTPTTDFSKSALVAAEHSASEGGVRAVAKPKLPSTFLEFSFGEHKWSNAHA